MPCVGEMGLAGKPKSSKPFSDLLLLCAAVMGGGYSIVIYFRAANWSLLVPPEYTNLWFYTVLYVALLLCHKTPLHAKFVNKVTG